MSISNTEFGSQIIKRTILKEGSIHFFNHLAVIEFNEGVHIDLISVKSTLDELLSYFGKSKPFGIITNRINSYSASTLDIKHARQALPNLSAYGIIWHNEAGRMNAKIESSFCQRKDICFDNLYDGLHTIYRRVKARLKKSLN
ncbi:hypothetical protein [uncultured Winogradskyella sp.]|uniref:hypothetical protein n=1 Tax=uncultured Winogradskyella sp. TaxID=395353 RepID=UPI00262A400F|nr:hypothetical protein [uncultured Winogradskyella sp.]